MGKRKKKLCMILAVALIMSLIPTAAIAESNAKNVTGQKQALKSLSLFQGTSSGDELDRTLTQVESIVMMVRLLGKEKIALSQEHAHPFTDVPLWAKPYVGYAYTNGLIKGVSETLLGADNLTTAPVFATMMLRALGYSEANGEFHWSTALDMARQLNLADKNMGTEQFKRADAVVMMYNALNVPMGKAYGMGNINLRDKLIAEGVFTEVQLDEAKELALHPKEEPLPSAGKQKPIVQHKTYKPYVPLGNKEEKVVYLTFDDGPNNTMTPKVLDILKSEKIKATFFVVGSWVDQNPTILKRIYDEGHAIGNHSYSHDYKYLYASPKNLKADILKAEESINKALGFEYGNHLFRFPGGSHGKSQALYDSVHNLGFQHFDWNGLGNDAVSKKGSTEKYIIDSTISTSKGKNHVTVLLHDASSKQTTVDALPEIIKYFKDAGYTFATLADAQ